MFFRQVLHEDLGCASYMVADRGEAAVVDPKWEIEDYVALAQEHDLRIAHVLETHNHADHVSGRGRLVEATGATVHIAEEAGVAYEHEPLADGGVLELGRARIAALATPGHRPEHLAFVVSDAARDATPWSVLTGDSLFVGDVARPDLAVHPEEGARGLYHSLRRLLELDDFAEVWPAHIGGSLCGGAAMSKKPSSTVGFERRFSPLLQLVDEEEFTRQLTAQLEPQPPNFERIVELNRGPPVLREREPEALSPTALASLVEAGAVVVDGRDPREFDAAHVPGSLNVTMTKSAVGTRAAWVVDAEADLALVAASDADARRLASLLEAVGFRRVRGFLAGGIGAWRGAHRELGTIPAIDVQTLAEKMQSGAALLVDVREEDEWQEGHAEASVHVPYHDLRDGVPAELREAGRPLAIACSAGNRSAVAASLLRRAGVDDVLHVADGGIEELPEHGVELVDG